MGDPRGEMANVFSSRVHGEPWTPVLPAYERRPDGRPPASRARRRSSTSFNLHGYKWFFQPGTPEDPASINNSGYRNGQQIGISEHFEFYLNQPPAHVPTPGTSEFGKSVNPLLASRRFTDHLYSSAAADNLWDGQWGILRVFAAAQWGGATQANGSGNALGPAAAASSNSGEGGDALIVPDPSDPTGTRGIALARLPNNPKPAETAEVPVEDGVTPAAASTTGADGKQMNSIVSPPPPAANVCQTVNRAYKVTAILARDLLPGGQIVYNQRSKLVDPNGIMFVNADNIPAFRSGAMPAEPLILRANAGECIEVTLTNELPQVLPENQSWNMMPMIVNNFNFNQVRTSNRVGLHAQLVAVNTFLDDGAFVGYNPDSTIGPGEQKTYRWYAGDRYVNYSNNQVTLTPIEFGATGFRDMADVIKHSSHGAIGSMIIEPSGSSWQTDLTSHASADIHDAASGKFLFREFVVMYQTDLSLQRARRGAVGGFPAPTAKHGGHGRRGRFRHEGVQLPH